MDHTNVAMESLGGIALNFLLFCKTSIALLFPIQQSSGLDYFKELHGTSRINLSREKLCKKPSEEATD